MPDPRREPFPDETQIDPDAPNRRARERLEETRRAAGRPDSSARRTGPGTEGSRARR
jgi:hypothetical protein